VTPQLASPVDGWWDPQVDQWVWQRRATAELASILAGHPDLPALCWTVRAAGCALTGQVDVMAAADATATTFAMWRQALGLQEWPGSGVADLGGVRRLRAAGSRSRVTVVLAGDLEPPSEPEAAAR
jgi:hypothetical protein